MAHALRLLVLSLLFSLSLASPASEQASKADLEAQKESLQLKIDSNQALTQKDIENLKSQLDGTGKRIDDQSNRIGDIGQSVDRFGILITLVVAVGGVFGYISAKIKAKEEAQQASQEWINSHQNELEKRIQQLEQAAKQAIQKAEQVRIKADQAHQQIENSASQVEQHGQDINAAMDRMMLQVSQSQSISPEDKETLHKNIKDLAKKPESEYSFIDWIKRGFDSYNSEKFEEAALYWKRASEIPNTESINKVTALLFRAIVLGEMNRTNEAINIYEQIIEEHGADSTPSVRKQVARAQLNKGFCLSLLGRREDAIATYDQLATNYAADSDPGVREQVAKAQVNKGVCLSQLGRREDAIAIFDQLITNYAADSDPGVREQGVKAQIGKGLTLGELGKPEDAIFTYDQLITNYATDPAPGVRRQVALALNGKGFAYFKQAKQEWAKPEKRQALLEEAQVSFLASLEKYSDSALILGNLAYTQWLLGNQQASEDAFHSALTAPESGGEFLYRATLDDIAQYPVPEDEGFRAMVERLWQEYQAQAPAKS